MRVPPSPPRSGFYSSASTSRPRRPPQPPREILAAFVDGPTDARAAAYRRDAPLSPPHKEGGVDQCRRGIGHMRAHGSLGGLFVSRQACCTQSSGRPQTHVGHIADPRNKASDGDALRCSRWPGRSSAGQARGAPRKEGRYRPGQQTTPALALAWPPSRPDLDCMLARIRRRLLIRRRSNVWDRAKRHSPTLSTPEAPRVTSEVAAWRQGAAVRRCLQSSSRRPIQPRCNPLLSPIS